MSDTYAGHYAYPLVTWRATFLGAVVAFVVAVMLNVLGAALGIAVLAAGQTTSAATGGIISAIWVAVANLLALGFGAWIATRSTETPDYHGGALQGIAVWALTSLATLWLATSSISSAAGAVMNTAGQAASAAASASSSMVGNTVSPTQAKDAAQNAAQDASAAYQQNAGAIQNAAQQAAGGAALAAFGVFIAMLLGLIAAIIGGRLGARHPKWENRPRYSYVEHRSPRT